MHQIELDATRLTTINDFYNALFAALGSPAWHGRNVNALIDSILWGEINDVSPPLTIRVRGISRIPQNVRDHIEFARKAILHARAESRGHQLDVEFETFD